MRNPYLDEIRECYIDDARSAAADEQDEILMKEYRNRFLEYDEELDDVFEIEDNRLIQEILADIRADLREDFTPHNEYYERPITQEDMKNALEDIRSAVREL